MTANPELAGEADLHYVETGAPGYRRRRRGSGFSYMNGTNETVNKQTRRYIESLVIPPAWEEVWIGKDRRGHILATGVDAAGRKQYIYHPEWEAIRDEVKFDRLAPFGRKVPDLRRAIDQDLRRPGLPRQKVIALAVAVLDRTLVRVGNLEYAQANDSYGLTTLKSEHIAVNGSHVNLDFTAKGKAERQLAFADRRLARLITRCQGLAGQTLFSYEKADGGSASIKSTDVNDYLADTTGMPFTAKDFRTWGASAVVTEELAEDSRTAASAPILEAIDVAAERLGNSRAICRDSYVHPRVLEAFERGDLGALWRRARPGKWIDRSESALRMLLEDHQ